MFISILNTFGCLSLQLEIIRKYTIDITFLFSIVCSAVCCCCIIVVVIVVVVVVVDDDDVVAVVAVVKMTSLNLTWFSLAINTNNHSK